MTVAELILELSKHPSDSEVYVHGVNIIRRSGIEKVQKIHDHSIVILTPFGRATKK